MMKTTNSIKQEDLSRGQTMLILGGAAIMLSLAMGIRQSWGLFQPHLIRDMGITAADFSLAIALQNVIWGTSQPFVGMLADRHGSRLIALAGTVAYALGLLISLYAQSALMFTLGAGVCLGLAMSCTGSQIAMNITARTATAAKRSVALGSVSALGSLGITFVSPMAQSLITGSGWEMALVVFIGLIAVMLPAAYFAGGADRIVVETTGIAQSAGEAVREALGHRGYMVLATAFFVCGLQLTFLTTHLPTYLALCGMDPTVGSNALALIGLFNIIGSYTFGWLGGRYSKRMLLGGIYVLRSLFITAYFLLPPSPTSTLVFAAAMGTLWLGVVPLVTGLIVHLFGLRYLATLSGIALFSHQLGSFVGAWGGGLIYSAFGSYDLAWKSGVAIGIIAGLTQMTMYTRPSARMERVRAPGLQAAS